MGAIVRNIGNGNIVAIEDVKNTLVLREIAEKGFSVGQRLVFTREITADDTDAFVKISGDNNPLHLRDDPTRRRFKERIAHGFHSASFISGLFGNEEEGLPNAVYLSQTLRFTGKVVHGDVLTVAGTITAYDPQKERISVNTVITNQRHEEVLTGDALLLVDEVRKSIVERFSMLDSQQPPVQELRRGNEWDAYMNPAFKAALQGSETMLELLLTWGRFNTRAMLAAGEFLQRNPFMELPRKSQ